MTEDKARKRAIRARMAKTGESYTAARRHFLRKEADTSASGVVADPGMSEEAITRGSGKGWGEWLRILDDWGAKQRPHKKIAAYVQEHGVSGWWAQTVAVGYERARGMRARYQTTEGFSVGDSKTFPVNVEPLFQAFADGRRRSRWLEAGTLRTRTTQPGKSARFDFKQGETRVHAYFTGKGESKSTVQIQHERLPDANAVEEMRAFWKERLQRLARLLEGKAGGAQTPPELQEVLSSRAAAKRAWEDLSPSHRKEYMEWISEAKRPDTRKRRAEKTATMLVEESETG
jgi:uncharacterized protein YndB with AHSA1/START domain